MPEIRDLVVDGQPARGYEVEFEVERDADIVVTHPDGTRVNIEITPRKIFMLVDADDQPLLNDAGEPRVVVESATKVASTSESPGALETGSARESDGVPSQEFKLRVANAKKKHAWLLAELAKR